MIIISGIMSFFEALIQGILSFIGLIANVIGFIFLGGLLVALGIMMENPDVDMIKGGDLTDYHAVGEVWQDICVSYEQSDGESREFNFALEFEFLEATDEYVKVRIRPVDILGGFEGKRFTFDLGENYWKKVIDGNGNEYSSNANDVLDIAAVYEDIPLDKDGITLYLYYSFKTKVPAGYIKISSYVDAYYENGRYHMNLNVYPHE